MFFLDRRYGFFTRPATARFSCTVKRLKVRRALGHSGVGIIIYIFQDLNGFSVSSTDMGNIPRSAPCIDPVDMQVYYHMKIGWKLTK
jgi:hypothetical protein